MASDNQVTLVGNLTDDPELRYTPNGAAVCKFRIAVNRRIPDGAGGWKDGEASYFSVNCWRSLGENAAESLTRGTRVVVAGRLNYRSWENQDGDKRSAIEIEADEVGPSLRWATARVERQSRSSSSSSGGDWGERVAAPVGGGGDRTGGDTTVMPPKKTRRPQAPSRQGRQGLAEEGQAQVLRLLQGADRLRRLQGRHHAAQVRERAGQDPCPPRHRQLRPAPARRRHGREERP